MDEFKALQNKIRGFSVNRILFKVWKNPIVQAEIIRLNTKDQLFEKGEDSLGVQLGEYSPFTKQIKVSKGQRIDHITLLDTGDYYESFKIRPFLKGFEINSDPDKGGGDNLFNDFGPQIEGLSEENKTKLFEFIRPFFNQEAAKALS